MRLKFLSIIAGFLTLSFVINGCIEGTSDYLYTSDANIYAFSLDTIHGVDYEFTIDHLNKVVYNRDSMPMGADTIIDQILIDSLTVSGWVTHADSIIEKNDTLNFTSAINNANGMKFIVYAPNGMTTCDYKIKINVHTQDPDSLVWQNMQNISPIFSTEINRGEQKSILLNNELLVYASHTTCYKSSTNLSDYGWSEQSISGLPETAILGSILNCEEKLYALADGDLYISSDGFTWNKSEALSGNLVSLIAAFHVNATATDGITLSAIKEVDGVNVFCKTTDFSSWVMGEEAPEEFPTANIYAAYQSTGNGINKATIVGMPQYGSNTIPWFTLNGLDWVSLDSNSSSLQCPKLNNPSIMYYAGMYYITGGSFLGIYSSETSVLWKYAGTKFSPLEEFVGKGFYSLNIDKDNYIWIIWGGKGATNEVWRGRLNRLGFEIQ